MMITKVSFYKNMFVKESFLFEGVCVFICLFLFEAGSLFEALAGLKLTDITLPQLPECQAHRHAPHTSLLVRF